MVLSVKKKISSKCFFMLSSPGVKIYEIAVMLAIKSRIKVTDYCHTFMNQNKMFYRKKKSNRDIIFEEI